MPCHNSISDSVPAWFPALLLAGPPRVPRHFAIKADGYEQEWYIAISAVRSPSVLGTCGIFCSGGVPKTRVPIAKLGNHPGGSHLTKLSVLGAKSQIIVNSIMPHTWF